VTVDFAFFLAVIFLFGFDAAEVFFRPLPLADFLDVFFVVAMLVISI
jgi:hypothetical protein